MQEFMVFAPNLQLQYSRLTRVLQLTEKMSLDYVSYLVHAHHLWHAIETSEQEGGIL
jgi:hypothetical protein